MFNLITCRVKIMMILSKHYILIMQIIIINYKNHINAKINLLFEHKCKNVWQGIFKILDK